MDPHHRLWNAQQHHLQDALSDPVSHPEWLALFLNQHAQVHSIAVSNNVTWSFEGEVLEGLTADALRVVRPKAGHSIAWILWHLARCEDLTMNMLVAGIEQVYERQGWKSRVRAPIDHTGNEIDTEEIMQFSQSVDLDALKAYRIAVAIATQQNVSVVPPEDLGKKVDPQRIVQVRRSGAVLAAAQGIVNYWSKRTIAGLLLMPPTRHCFTHLNEGLRIKKALG
jgi:hypothetical protein